jgi:hypothetical protein
MGITRVGGLAVTLVGDYHFHHFRGLVLEHDNGQIATRRLSSCDKRVGLPEGRDPGPWPVLHHTGQHRRTTRRRRTMAASANESQQKATNRENLRLLVEWILLVNRL